MKKGTIPRILNYYFHQTQFRDELLRALREFFNQPEIRPGGKIELRDEKDEAMFNEWFIFDFKLSNGKTPLKDFYERNPYSLNRDSLQLYKDLQDNHFGFYKVKEVRLGQGLTLENLQTGKIYQVREISATFCLSEGQVFSGRVGKVGDHYELVGANPSFGPVKFDEKVEKLFRKDKRRLTPKILRDYFLKEETTQDNLKDFLSLEEAEVEFQKILTKYNLDQFVTTALIKEWIYHRSGDDPVNFVHMLCSLLSPEIEDYNNALTEILEGFGAFYNFCPQKELGGKSPFEKAKEHKDKGIPADVMLSLHKFSPQDWGKNYNQALQYMKKAEFKKALKKFNQVLAYLLKHKITCPEIYRLYANKGTCHFALGQLETTKFMLETSCELNPLYDFAQKQLKRYKKIEKKLKTIPPLIKKVKKEKDITEDIGYRYYQFLKPFKINFAHTPKDLLIITIRKKLKK